MYRSIRPRKKYLQQKPALLPLHKTLGSVQETTKYKIRKYREGDIIWMWDTQKGEPTNVKGSTQSWLGPFKVGRESVNDSYYLSTLEGRRRPLPISERLLKPH
jgi:hypothetical protein